MDYYENEVNNRKFVSHLIKFDKHQLNEIIAGSLIGLSVDQIAIYAKPEFNSKIMSIIRYAIIDGMDIEKVKIFADTRFIAPQILAIKAGFDYGLSIEEVRTYTNPEYTHMEMTDIIKQILNSKD